jgi:hypothetical protein
MAFLLPIALLPISTLPASAEPALSLFEALQVLAFGLLVVVALTQHRLATRLDALERRAVRPPAVPALPEPPSVSEPSLPARTAVILAAAAMEACDEPVRIIAIREEARPGATPWSLEGRRHIFASHTTR